MNIKTAEFIISNTDYNKCPKPDRPEFAFIGRSNVGKSSLINALAQRNSLAKTSNKPGKTQTINHFLINNQWYLVDLPGYGFAKVSQSDRYNWGIMIEKYLVNRENLCCTFILIDSRHDLQAIDMDFIHWMGEKKLPITIIQTKSDKLKRAELEKSTQTLESKLLEFWAELPPLFVTSAETKKGIDGVLDFIQNTLTISRSK